MAWNDASETIVSGKGQVYVADVGTALPATADAALNGAFEGLGFHTEDGVSLNKSLEIVEFRSWQSLHPIRREREADDFQLTFVLEQWNEVNLPLAMGGGDVLDLGGGQVRYNPPDDGAPLDEKSL